MYKLVVVYHDGTVKNEVADLPSLLRAVAIYYEDPDFFIAHIIDTETEDIIGDLYRKGI